MAKKMMISSHTILIADDDADIRSIISTVLTDIGLNVIEAVDGTMAWELFQSSKPDIVILDLMMPGYDGNQVCKMIKDSEQGHAVPVIILTARADLRDKVDSLSEGADDYITKPFHFQELQARVKVFLRIRELNQKLTHKNEELLRLQEKLIEQERKIAVTQLAGTAAHQLGQPLAAMILNCHLLEGVAASEETAKKALLAIKSDCKRMKHIIESLKLADASKSEEYFKGEKIIEIDDIEKQ